VVPTNKSNSVAAPGFHEKVTLEPARVVPGVGLIRIAGATVAWNPLDTLVRFSGGASEGFKDRVAMRESLVSAVWVKRLLKVADPAERAFEVVPISTPSLSVMVIKPLAAEAATPLSVNATTGAGKIDWNVAMAGGSVAKASA